MSDVAGYWAVALMFATVAACAAEVAMLGWTAPRWQLRSWLMWGALGASLITVIALELSTGLDAALFTGLVVGLVCQPIGRTFLWIANKREVVAELNRWEGRSERADLAWMETAFWRMGRNRPEPAPEPRPAPKAFLRAQAIVTVVVAVSWPVVSVLADRMREPSRREMVAQHLATQGFENARVRRAQTSGPCWGGVEYAWTADAGDGRACVRDGDHVTLLVERDRTSKDPFARPAR